MGCDDLHTCASRCISRPPRWTATPIHPQSETRNKPSSPCTWLAVQMRRPSGTAEGRGSAGGAPAERTQRAADPRVPRRRAAPVAPSPGVEQQQNRSRQPDQERVTAKRAGGRAHSTPRQGPHHHCCELLSGWVLRRACLPTSICRGKSASEWKGLVCSRRRTRSAAVNAVRKARSSTSQPCRLPGRQAGTRERTRP